MASVTLVVLLRDQCDTYWETEKMHLAPLVRHLSIGSPHTQTPHRHLASWNFFGETHLLLPASLIRPILGVYEVSMEPIIGSPQGPSALVKSFAKLLQWNSSISFFTPSGRQESNCQIVNRAPLKGPPTQSYKGHKAICAGGANFQQKVVFYQGGGQRKPMQFHFET